jgi:outer membrane protein
VKKRIHALVYLSLVGGLLAVSQAVAQSEPQAPAGSAPVGRATATKVGIIQAQNALLGTHDGQRALNEMNKKMEPTKAALDKKANDIRELQDKLQRGGNAMADAAKAELTRNIDQKTKAYNRDMEDAQAEAESEQRKLMDDLSGKMTKVIDNYAVANGYSLILDVSNPQTPVLYASTNTDITKDIVDLYDKTYPVSLPAGSPAPSAAKPSTPAPKPPASTTTTPATPKKQP